MAHIIIAAINRTGLGAIPPPSRTEKKHPPTLSHNSALKHGANFIVDKITHDYFWSPKNDKFVELGMLDKIICWIQNPWNYTSTKTHTCAQRTWEAIKSDAEKMKGEKHFLDQEWLVLSKEAQPVKAGFIDLRTMHLKSWQKLNDLIFPPDPENKSRVVTSVSQLQINAPFLEYFKPEDAAPPEDDRSFSDFSDDSSIVSEQLSTRPGTPSLAGAGVGAGGAGAAPPEDDGAGVGEGEDGFEIVEDMLPPMPEAPPQATLTQPFEILPADSAAFIEKLGPELSPSKRGNLIGLIVDVLKKDASFISSTVKTGWFAAINLRRIANAHSIPPLGLLVELISNTAIKAAYEQGCSADKGNTYHSYFEMACSFYFDHLPSTQGEFELFLNVLNIPHGSRATLRNAFRSLNKPQAEQMGLRPTLWAGIIETILTMNPTE